MKKRIISVLLMILVAFTACSLTACFFDKGDDEEGDDIYVTYHLNGGYTGGNPDNTEDYKDNIGTHNLYSYKPITAKRPTWYLEGWYFDEQFTEQFSSERFVELYNAKPKSICTPIG